MRTIFILGGLFIGLGLLWGPGKWHTGPSMVLVAELKVSWATWGALFLMYSTLLLVHTTRVLGYFMGFVLYSFFTGSFLLASFQGNLSNLILLVVSINATAQQAVWAIKTMIEEAGRPWAPAPS